MSEAARARERLEFEAAAEAIGKGKCGKESSFSNQQFTEIHATTGLQFTSGGLEVRVRRNNNPFLVCSFDLELLTLVSENSKIVKQKSSRRNCIRSVKSFSGGLHQFCVSGLI